MKTKTKPIKIDRSTQFRKAKPIKANGQTLVAFLLDRTGSMESIKQETIGGFNGYLDELLKKPESKDIKFHFTQFDTIGIDVVHDMIPLAKVDRLTKETFKPRANTPLYDAIGKTIRNIEGKANGFKVLFVTLTDGQENSSSEWTQESIRDLIKQKEENDKWTFSYIGIGPDAWEANRALAVGTQGVNNVLRSSKGNAQKVYARMARASMNVVCSVGGQSVGNLYDEKDQLDK